jgi:hypothetical protein
MQEERFRPMRCRRCGNEIAPNADVIARLQAKGKGMTAGTRSDCVWQCSCGVVYSNAIREADRVMIVDRPELNVPKEVRAGLASTLDASANKFNLDNKRAKFCYETSEDAVTWTVFRGLQQLRKLGLVPAPQPISGEPHLLLWGATTGAGPSHGAESGLESISLSLREDPDRRSEPDVILAWNDLVVFVEAKYRSNNDCKPGYPNFGRYLDRPDLFTAGPDAIKTAGYYELTRNWRIGVELAERLHAETFLLLNLGPPALSSSAGKFAALLKQSDKHRFIHRTWREVLDSARTLPDWLTDFAQKRSLTKH